jgi:hypothetical protein
MRLMDRRYKNLSLEELDAWVYAVERATRPVELWGWFDGEVDDVAQLRQVMGYTFRVGEGGQRCDLFLEHLGVAADVIPEAERTPGDVETWYRRFLLQLKRLVGLEETITTMRPLRMTFEPMRSMHDCVPLGLTAQAVLEPGIPAYRMHIDKERDKGNALFWKMRIVRADQPSPPVTPTA